MMDKTVSVSLSVGAGVPERAAVSRDSQTRHKKKEEKEEKNVRYGSQQAASSHITTSKEYTSMESDRFGRASIRQTGSVHRGVKSTEGVRRAQSKKKNMFSGEWEREIEDENPN